jgi:hypothetical protein
MSLPAMSEDTATATTAEPVAPPAASPTESPQWFNEAEAPGLRDAYDGTPRRQHADAHSAARELTRKRREEVEADGVTDDADPIIELKYTDGRAPDAEVSAKEAAKDINIYRAEKAAQLLAEMTNMGAGWSNERLLAFCEAVWTQPMRWFGAAFIWFQHVGNRAGPDWLKLIIILLGIPLFQASHFCFKRAYAITLRRIRLAGLYGLVQCLQDDALQLDGLGPKCLSIAQIYHRLRDIKHRTEACNSSGNFCDGHS